MQGTISKLQVLDGKFGKFTSIEINGQKITAYNQWHDAATNMKQGDTVEYDTVQKGQYFNFSLLKLVSAGAAPAAAESASRSRQDFLSKEEGVITSYAKDLLVGGLTAEPDKAVDMVFALITKVKAGMKENPTS